MQNTPIFVKESILKNPLSNLYFLMDKSVRNKFFVTTSFSKIDKQRINVFTDINSYVAKIIDDYSLKQYMFILDSSDLVKIEAQHLNYLAQALKVIVVGELGKQSQLFRNFANVINIHVIADGFYSKKADTENLFCLEKDLSYVYANQLEKIEAKKLYVLSNSNLSYWRGLFEVADVSFVQLPVSINSYNFCLDKLNFIGFPARAITEQHISVAGFVELIDQICSVNVQSVVSTDTRVNIVCFNPTYLFKDLVDRFVDKGCIHSDFPLPNCQSYIWMRPQEIWHLEYILQGRTHKEISAKYYEVAKTSIVKLDFDEIKRRSVAIHHGTCYEPLYQFDYNLLTRSLYNVSKVVGVCEFEECYGPSHNIANQRNFHFVPIGYDHNLFLSSLISSSQRQSGSTVNIGFVGRAYGTSDFKLLAKSKLAEPKGYRKGGDLLEALASKLKLLSIDAHFHILGQNWEHVVEYFDAVGIRYTYYARDKNITYREYPNVYAKMDALLISARCEGGPVSAIEALSLGVPLVSTNVGVVRYLAKEIEAGVNTFNYDKKWHVADLNMAIDHIKRIYHEPTNYVEKLKISESVKKFTTDHWVEEIIEYAVGL